MASLAALSPTPDTARISCTGPVTASGSKNMRIPTSWRATARRWRPATPFRSSRGFTWPADPAEPARLVEAVASRFGGLDILVANAGGPPPARALDVTDEQVEAAVNQNLLTSVRLVREAVPWMRTSGWGRVCLITSFTIKTP